MSADTPGAWRSRRSTPRPGKPVTWGRAAAGSRHAMPFGRAGVNTSAPLDAKAAEERVLGWQTKLHRWTTQGKERRFDDLFNLLFDHATLLVAGKRGERNG